MRSHGFLFPWPFVRILPRAILHDWVYSVAGKRDLRIDLLRGFAVWMMIVNHFGGRSWLFLVTGGDAFWISAAEIFVFISGVTVGIVYGGIAREESLRAAQVKALRRAWTLYKLTVVLTLGLAGVSFLFHLPWIDQIKLEHPLGFVLNVLALRQTLYLADIMLLYTFLMLGTPLALWLLRHQHALGLLTVSGATWLLFQVAHTSLPWQIANNTTFHFAAWQLIFYCAMVLGYHREQIKQSLLRLPRAPMLMFFGVVAALLLDLHQELAMNAQMTAWFVKSAVAPGRLVVGLVFFSFAYLLVTLGWKPLRWVLGWLLLPLGQNALYAYTIHVGVIALWYTARLFLPVDASFEAEVTTLAQMSAVLVILTLIKIKFLFRLIPR